MKSDLGTFYGFNTRTGKIIREPLTAAEVIAWDHYKDGIAEFRPTGDRREVQCLIGWLGNPCARFLKSLDKTLQDLGGDTLHNFLLLHYVLNGLEYDLRCTSLEEILDLTSEVEIDADPNAPIKAQFYNLERMHEYEFAEGP